MNVPPKTVTKVVAEFVRAEPGGKFTLIGVYADGRIVFPKQTAFPVMFPVALYFMFPDGEGTFETSLRVSDPSGSPVFTRTLPDSVKVKGEPLTITVGIPVFPANTLGDYLATLTLDSTDYAVRFSAQD
jgi:hypothetical protein